MDLLAENIPINLIKGEAIDGYIEGAEIFIDQNYNLLKIRKNTVHSDSSGSFTIEVNQMIMSA